MTLHVLLTLQPVPGTLTPKSLLQQLSIQSKVSQKYEGAVGSRNGGYMSTCHLIVIKGEWCQMST